MNSLVSPEVLMPKTGRVSEPEFTARIVAIATMGAAPDRPIRTQWKWHGPFDRDRAFRKANPLRQADMEPCGTCSS